jgi:hypothetical protein
MARELSRPYDYQPAQQSTQKSPSREERPVFDKDVKTPSTVDIKMISGNGFLLNMRQTGTEVFAITLDGLDRMIEDKILELHQPPTDESNESLKQKLPTFLHDSLDFFSKQQSDTLSPHRSTDHKIELTEENTLGFCHLRKHTLEELTAMREYLSASLIKGFIVLSKVPFASLILFARKADESLRFCVNYRKLNALIKKNRYPLPLIDETLAQLSKAKIFIKLDIHQAFHRI